MVTNEQLYMVVGIPMRCNALLIGLGIAFLNAKSANLTQASTVNGPAWTASTSVSTTCAICGAPSCGEWKKCSMRG